MMKSDWSSSFQGYWAAEYLRIWATQRLEEVKAGEYETARAALFSESWKTGFDLSGVPPEVLKAYDLCARTARVALRRVPPEVDNAVAALESAHALVTP